MRTASASCLQSQNREAKASVARAEDDEQWTGISAAYRYFFTGNVNTGQRGVRIMALRGVRMPNGAALLSRLHVPSALVRIHG